MPRQSYYGRFFAALMAVSLWANLVAAQSWTGIQQELDACNIIWKEQSKNSSESMPCGGGDIGLNVWVENNEILLYLSQSGMFDENNALLKAGRLRLKLSPNPFEGKSFRQELVLKDGQVKISGKTGSVSADILIWVDVSNPAIHLEIKSDKPVKATAGFESWRHENRALTTAENKANSWKWAKVPVITQKDIIGFKDNGILFYHRNSDSTVFDFTVRQQGLDSVKEQLFNPLKQLTFGGMMQGSNMKPAGVYSGQYCNTAFMGWKLESSKALSDQRIDIVLHTRQTPSASVWMDELNNISQKSLYNYLQLKEQTRKWWNQFWDRSFIFIQGKGHPLNQGATSAVNWETSRNYQLFRYMLGCNATGKYPTKFNGGLFTFDPVFTDSTLPGTPDHRNWGGGTFTAQNQRLVYWPMLKSGDFDMMESQFKFYLQILKNATTRSAVYWKHGGAVFSEQIENFGLPNMAEYGFKRPDYFDEGVEYNAWLEYEWDTVLEFCQMMLETELYASKNISAYIPLIENGLIFFDEHYQYLAKQRGIKKLDEDNHLIIYPGSGAETFKMAYNASSTIAALQTVTKKLLLSKYLPEERKKYFSELLNRIPPISFTSFNGHTTIAPAKHWERVNNIETPQLYPVFPWGIFGVGKPGLDTAINTWYYDSLAVKFRSTVGWKQDNIFAARLGLKGEAAKLTGLKLRNSQKRFPTFWGPGFDWTPDHNHGGTGMIGLQEMLLQTDGNKIFLFPAWPKNIDVHFKLHAPLNTTIEVTLQNGQINQLEITPKERATDIINLL